jgi:uncharacterized membrane protein
MLKSLEELDMDFSHLGVESSAIIAAFLASTVEVVEAFTIVLAVGTLQGWKPAWVGTFAALLLLALAIIILGPLLGRVPINNLQLVIGVLLLLFGMGWLRKAILRSAGVLPLHDEDKIFAEEQASLIEERKSKKTSQDWIAGIAAFKAVLLEGLEVVFIVIAVGSGRNMLWPAAMGALAACVAVLIIGVLVHKPLSRVPENTLKFCVGVMLSSFGVFWTGEGLGIIWPGQDLILLLFGAIFLAAGLLTAFALRVEPQAPQKLKPAK